MKNLFPRSTNGKSTPEPTSILGNETETHEHSPNFQDTVINQACRIDGKLTSQGNVWIAGMLDGQVCIQGDLYVSPDSVIVAAAGIEARNITVSGQVNGNIKASKLQITETGKVWGDLNVDKLLLHEGAFLSGQTSMAQDLPPPLLSGQDETPLIPGLLAGPESLAR